MEGNSTGVPFLEIGISHLGQVWVFVGVAMLVSTWLRAVWHSDYMTRVASVIPESGMLLVLGLVFGIIVHYGNLLSLDQFNGGDIFFDVLLPLILLPSTYYLDVNVFLSRLELVFIMLFAVLGTVISAVVTGLVIYYASPIFVVPIPILVALAYGALLAATDPVAVLATFDQLKVNDRLANIVEGEATLNDAAGITLFGFFLSLAKEHVSLSGAAIGLAVAQFFVITLGAAGFGIIGGILGSLLSRCSNRLGVLEPLMVMIHGLLVYTCANWLGLSGIIGLFVCNLIQSLFVDRFVSSFVRFLHVLTHFLCAQESQRSFSSWNEVAVGSSWPFGRDARFHFGRCDNVSVHRWLGCKQSRCSLGRSIDRDYIRSDSRDTIRVDFSDLFRCAHVLPPFASRALLRHGGSIVERAAWSRRICSCGFVSKHISFEKRARDNSDCGDLGDALCDWNNYKAFNQAFARQAGRRRRWRRRLCIRNASGDTPATRTCPETE